MTGDGKAAIGAVVQGREGVKEVRKEQIQACGKRRKYGSSQSGSSGRRNHDTLIHRPAALTSHIHSSTNIGHAPVDNMLRACEAAALNSISKSLSAVVKARD
jgi:hypothetical protein